MRLTKLVLVTAGLAGWFGAVSGADAASVNPPSHGYGSLPVGATSAAVSFTLTTGPSVCTSYDYGSPPPYPCWAWAGMTDDTSSLGGGQGSTTRVGDFLVHNTNCDYPAYTGPPYQGTGYCQFEASFSPVAAGARSTTLSFPENPSGASASLTLTGTGLGSAAAHKKCKKRHHRKHCKKKR